jgi:peptidyl-prolyl cis-trans isomerase C
MFPKTKIHIVLLALSVVLASCKANPVINPSPSIPLPSKTIQPQQPTSTNTPVVPTTTPEPMAAIVDDGGITLAEYNAELQRLQASLQESGKTMAAADEQNQVLNQLIDETLLAQAAYKNGYTLDDASLQQQMDDLANQPGASMTLAQWMEKNFYSEESLKTALRRSLAAAWQRDQVTASAPQTADQVHVRQMLFLDPDTADRYYQQLQAGAKFATLAYVVDPDTGGDLGWFPRNYLLLPEIEKAAFDLQPGSYSQIIKTTYGYQIIYVEERDSQHPLSADARRSIQRQMLNDWLAAQRSQAKIQILVKP